MLEVAF